MTKSFKPDVNNLKLVDQIEMASAAARKKGREQDAVALFRLRQQIRQGLPFAEAKQIFDEHTKGLFEK